MRLHGFIGPSNISPSFNVDCEETINLIVEVSDAGTGKVPRASYRRPGVEVWDRLASGPVRGMFGEDGRAWAVSGNRFYELFESRRAIERGTVAVDLNPATIVSNGQEHGSQLFVVSGGLGYIYDLATNTLAPVASADFVEPSLMGAFLNSRFLSLKAASNQFNWSALLDGDVWAALDVARVSQTSDLVRCLIVAHQTIWLFGSQRSAVWYNPASGNTTFAPIASADIQMGTAASFSPCVVDNTIYWLGENQDGSRVVFRAKGYAPERVSTHAIETYLYALSHVHDAIAWTFQERGHTFYVLYLPVADHTLVYDVSSQTWVKWAQWDNVVCKFFPYLGRCHTYAFGKHLIGDRQSGTIYHQSLTFTDDSYILAEGL